MQGLTLVGPVGIRGFHLEKLCETSEGHQHNYDHTTIVIRGRLKVTYRYEKDGQIVEGESAEFGQNEAFVIKAKVFHTLKALEPDTLYSCIFSHRDFDGQIVQNYAGNQAAYEVARV